MHTDETKPDFSTLIKKYIERSEHKEEKLARLAKERFGHISGFDLKDSTIRNWRYKAVRSIREWQQLVALATVLRLSRAEADELCRTARLPDLEILHKQYAKPDEQDLFQVWMEPVFTEQVQASLLNIQEGISGTKTEVERLGKEVRTALFQWLLPFSSRKPEAAILPLVRDLERRSFKLGDDIAANFPYIITPIQSTYLATTQALRRVSVGTGGAKRGILIIGEANSGKTRLALELLYQTLSNWFVLRWSPAYKILDAPASAVMRSNDVVVLIDDLQEYVPAESQDMNIQALLNDSRTTTLQTLLEIVRGTARHVVVVATCRLEDEMQVRARLGWLFEELEVFMLKPFNLDPHNSEAAAIIAEFQRHGLIHINDWDGTLGSLVLGLPVKNSEYLKVRNEPAATVLRAMKLLTLAGTSNHTKRRIQEVCLGVFDDEMLKKSKKVWRLTIDHLIRLQFVTEETFGGKGSVSLVIRKDAYFDQVITDYPSPNRPHQLDQDFAQLQDVFVALKDSDALLDLAESLHRMNQDEEALKAIDHALTLRPDNVIIWNSKSILLLILKRYEEALTAYDRALALQPTYLPAIEGRNATLLLMEPTRVDNVKPRDDVRLKSRLYQLIEGFLLLHMKKQIKLFQEIWELLQSLPLETLGKDLKQFPSAPQGLGFAGSEELLPVIAVISWAILTWQNEDSIHPAFSRTIIVQEAKSQGCSEALSHALATYLESHLLNIS